MDTIFITTEEEGNRIDSILANRFQYSRSYFQSLIKQQRVWLNGENIKKRIIPNAGDEVEIHFVFSNEINVLPENIPLDILYEDDDIVVVNKPAGMVVHPATGNWSGTFVNALLHHCKDLPANTHCRPGIVHRLDKDTSGVLIAAKTLPAQESLINMFSNKEVYKEYLAICRGNPGNRTINLPIGRHPVKRKEMAVIENGKPSITHCTTLHVKGECSVVKVILETGRTHQIRVHLSHLGTPIMGDSVYGKTEDHRQLLHASLIRFPHPVSKKMIEVKAPLPDDMMKKMKFFLAQ